MSEAARTEEHELIIVGAGPAGLCAGLYAGRSEMDAVMLDKGMPGGQLLLTELVDDYPGVQEIGGIELAQEMAEHSARFGVEAVQHEVTSIQREEDGTFRVITDDGPVYRAPAVILTAGGEHRTLDIPGEEEYRGHGVSYCAICDGAFFKGETIAVVGGGDSAVEESVFLTRYAEKVYVIHRRDEFRAQQVLQDRLFANDDIEVIWDTVVREIHGDEEGVTHLDLENVETGDERKLPVSGVFIFIGFVPNSGILDFHVEHDAAGYVLTDEHMQSSVPGLFVAGDVRAQLVRQITTAVGDATTALFAAEGYLDALEDGDGAGMASRETPAVAAPRG